MPSEPRTKTVIAFFDGQNLFHAVKKAFGYHYPNYYPKALAEEICKAKGWTLQQTRFYTGVPDQQDNPFWHYFWHRKLAVMGTRGIHRLSRPLRYRNQTVILPDGSATTTLVGQEKGIDVRIALDIVRLAREGRYDIALIFSQDQDLSEAVDEVKEISIQQNKWIKIACAFPTSPTHKNNRGINKTEWIKFDRKTYDQCLDPNDYRPKRINTSER